MLNACDCVLRFTIFGDSFFIFSFQSQIVLNLFLFLRRFEFHCSYKSVLKFKKCISLVFGNFARVGRRCAPRNCLLTNLDRDCKLLFNRRNSCVFRMFKDYNIVIEHLQS